MHFARVPSGDGQLSRLLLSPLPAVTDMFVARCHPDPGAVLRLCGCTDTPAPAGHTFPPDVMGRSWPQGREPLLPVLPWLCPQQSTSPRWASVSPFVQRRPQTQRLSCLRSWAGWPRCPWESGGRKGQSCKVANVATWWWISGEHLQLDGALLEDLWQVPSAEGGGGTAEAGWSPRGLLPGAGQGWRAPSWHLVKSRHLWPSPSAQPWPATWLLPVPQTFPE